MADGKRRYKSDRKDYKISVKLSEKDMDILDEAVRKSGKTVSEYVRELIRLGGNVDFRYPEDRARVIRIFLVLQIISIRQLDLEIHKENCTSAILISCREVLMKSKVYSGRCWRHGDYKDPEYKGIKRKKSGITSGKCITVYPKSRQDRRMCSSGQYQLPAGYCI